MSDTQTTFSIAQLKLAEELCFPDDFRRLMEKYEPAFACSHTYAFTNLCEGRLTRWIFSFSREDYCEGMVGTINAVVRDLIGEDSCIS